MKLLSWNINGLRAISRKHSSIQEVLIGDVVCLQETKLTKSELSRELALVPGWESFFAFSSSRTGYSGVATFTRASIALPLEAFTTLAEFLRSYDIVQDMFWEEIEELDLEGRCVVTVHVEFVLFNFYAPALTKETELEDRMQLKVKWFQILDNCVQALVQKGFNVVLMGDFNCTLELIDHCNPCPPSSPPTPPSIEEFKARVDRQVLLKMLCRNGGLCHDIYRRFHSTKKEAYSCWNQSTNARVNNYGTRIDLILAAGAGAGSDPDSFIESFTDSGIMTDILGSDHAPVWAERTSIEDPNLRTRSIPKTSSRFLFPGRQTTMDLYLINNEDQKRILDSPQEEGSRPKKKARQIKLKAFMESLPESPPPPPIEIQQPIRQETGLVEEWKSLFDKIKPPLCNGHGESCVVREVKKSGPNKGRRFYVCARADGPVPIGRCDHFQWADKIKKRR